MNNDATCPVCRSGCAAFSVPRDADGTDCPRCGRFEVSRTAIVDGGDGVGLRLSPLEIAVLSHKLRTTSRGARPPMVTTVVLDGLKGERMPSRMAQAANLIRLVGDTIGAGGAYVADDGDTGVVGALNPHDCQRLRAELNGAGLLASLGPLAYTDFYGDQVSRPGYDLTLSGWERYEAERRGQVAGRYGFLAMRFGDAVLEAFATNVLKPVISDGIGFDLVDLRDVARAGIIDNLLREQIRDAAFVLVDLTHDNAGAYWEAGYAEGLGKPVVYLCEKGKFEELSTHFDTNHSTTVPWSASDTETFGKTLVATLRRSLNLFPEREGS